MSGFYKELYMNNFERVDKMGKVLEIKTYQK